MHRAFKFGEVEVGVRKIINDHKTLVRSDALLTKHLSFRSSSNKLWENDEDVHEKDEEIGEETIVTDPEALAELLKRKLEIIERADY